MASLFPTSAEHSRELAANEILLVQGESGGDLFVLESGRLTVDRDGVTIATLSQRGTLIGEMSVLLGTSNSATVRAEQSSRVQVIRDARALLQQDPKLCFSVATLVAARLDATSALLVELTGSHTSKNEQGLLNRILSALHVSPYATETLARRDMFET